MGKVCVVTSNQGVSSMTFALATFTSKYAGKPRSVERKFKVVETTYVKPKSENPDSTDPFVFRSVRSRPLYRA